MSPLTLKYQGFFSDSITGQLTALMESALVESHRDYRTRTRLKALLVEQIQNIQRYSSQSRQGTLVVAEEGGSLYVETVNPIDPEDRDRLEARLEGLVDADPKTLQKRFREAMREPFNEGDQGAGLGFLFLAKKSSRRLEHRFVAGEGPELNFQLRSYL